MAPYEPHEKPEAYCNIPGVKINTGPFPLPRRQPCPCGVIPANGKTLCRKCAKKAKVEK